MGVRGGSRVTAGSGPIALHRGMDLLHGTGEGSGLTAYAGGNNTDIHHDSDCRKSKLSFHTEKCQCKTGFP